MNYEERNEFIAEKLAEYRKKPAILENAEMSKKSQLVSFVLTFVFGPLGVLYSSVIVSALCIIAMILAAGSLGPAGGFLVWVFSILSGAVMVEKHNVARMIKLKTENGAEL